MQKGVVWVLALLLFAVPVLAPFTGTIEGYVYFLNGTLAGSSASVNVSLASCSGSGCTGNTTTDANSYYVIANLNLAANGALTASGGKNLHHGENTTTANAYQAAYANITICRPPSAPSLGSTPSNHDKNRTLSWTSGTDPSGFTKYDVFQFAANASIISATSPRNVSNLTVGDSYTWRVSTCNTLNGRGCCSDNVTQTFNVTNGAPSAPTLVDQDNTGNDTVSLNWTSGTDSDGDTTHDELQFSATSDFSDLIDSSSSASPLYVISGLTNTTTYFWRVRTCDQYSSCSNYATDNFTIYTCIVLITQNVTSGGGGGGGGSTCGANECQMGDRACRGNSKLVCGDYNNDAYLEFKAEACSPWEKCQNGNCVSACSENWQCSEWSVCAITGIQHRSCEDANYCDTKAVKPTEERACIPFTEAPVYIPPLLVSSPFLAVNAILLLAILMLVAQVIVLLLIILLGRRIELMHVSKSLRQMSELLRKGDFVQADLFRTQVLEPRIARAVLDERDPSHRKLLRTFVEQKLALARHYLKLAEKSGDKGKVASWRKRVDEIVKLTERYA
ncbi:MAG TPA: hypothetical protein VLJ21_03195 [Candidatus Binatia bacterium]|nr:hypothetical protein [Candidatus Binatia bacterium]